MTKSRFELRTFGSDTMLNHLSPKLKLIRRGKFNHLINTLTPNMLWCPGVGRRNRKSMISRKRNLVHGRYHCSSLMFGT
jgi:hypothetical protein